MRYLILIALFLLSHLGFAYVPNEVSSGAAKYVLYTARVAAGSVNAQCTSGSCTIYNSSGTWLTATHSGTGNYSISFSTAFASTPGCICSDAGANGAGGCMVNVVSTSAATILTLNGTTASDDVFNIFCMGPR